MDHIDLFKELEMARNNIRERTEEINREIEEVNLDDPP
jgi:hypothetical protein